MQDDGKTIDRIDIRTVVCITLIDGTQVYMDDRDIKQMQLVLAEFTK